MEDGSSSGGTRKASRKMKFKPEVPPRQLFKPTEVKREAPQDEDETQWQKLVKVGSGRKVAARKKHAAPVQVSFGYSSTSSSEKSLVNRRAFNAVGTNVQVRDTHKVPTDDSSAPGPQTVEMEFVEPWDNNSYYPVTLPLRRPYSRNPEHLNGQDAIEASGILGQEETRLNSAVELGLMGHLEEEQMLFFHLPTSLPCIKRLASTKGKETAHSLDQERRLVEKGCGFEDLPAGIMGKLLIFKSGSVKLKLGDTLFDVSPGVDCTCAQDIAVINLVEKHCCVLGSCPTCAVVSLDVDCLLGGST